MSDEHLQEPFLDGPEPNARARADLRAGVALSVLWWVETEADADDARPLRDDEV